MLAGIVFNTVGISMVAFGALLVIPVLAIAGIGAAIWRANRPTEP